ncbi:unnamed protein product [Protopolystoma xenopodis]|uniref:CN hydrolase domain-containing protein n=1 Tax=Protopolystoma xenopodis TaxID=117903 RepID=A0A448WV40_9PLAT|nr:unnamed protein product [Protopolystoma xenopodis]
MVTIPIGVLQLCSTHDKEQNFHNASALIQLAKKNEAQVVFLPECFDFVGRSKSDVFSLSEMIDGPLITKYCDLAKECNLWISLGGMHRKVMVRHESPDNRVYNSHILIDSEGGIRGLYDKAHLFDAKLTDDTQQLSESETNEPSKEKPKPYVFMESEIVIPGKTPAVVVPRTPLGSLSLAICYDLRFPELAAHARHLGGARVLTYPAAFSLPTGQAGHWHILLRARAIETQCFLVAAAQRYCIAYFLL